eukprot:COSAG01_NODE_39321_length_478_cov_0.686016_1_plen_147_part_10
MLQQIGSALPPKTLAQFYAVCPRIRDAVGAQYAAVAVQMRLHAPWLREHNLKLDDTEVSLNRNHIQDLTPLAGLTTLTNLSLHCNRIQDLTPIGMMPTLTVLCIGGNQIQDVTPLAFLHRLDTLYLGHNQILDLTALAGLTALTELH